MTPTLRLQIPVTPRVVAPRTFRGVVIGGSEPPPQNFLRIFLYASYDWNASDPTDINVPLVDGGGNPIPGSGIICSRFQKGFNYAAVWEPFLRAKTEARGRPWSPGAAVISGGRDITEVRYWTGFTGGSRGTTGAHVWVQLAGELIFDLAAAHDAVQFGHAPPLYHVQQVNARSTIGTVVLSGLHNFESVNQGPESYAALEPARLISRQHVVVAKTTSGCASDGLNRYGCTSIDKAEGQDSGLSFPTCTGTPSWTPGVLGCPHTPAHAGLPPNATAFTKHSWDCDVTVTAYQDDLVAAWLAFMDGYLDGGVWRLAGLVQDNMSINKFKGESTVLYPDAYTDAVYQAGWRAFEAKLAAAIAASGKSTDPDRFRWANASDLMSAYSATDIRNRFVEGFFIDPSGSKSRRWVADPGDPVEYGIENALDRVAANGLRAVLAYTGSFQGQTTWWTTTGGPSPSTNGTWQMIFDKVLALGAFANVYANSIRTNSIGYGSWQTGWRPIG